MWNCKKKSYPCWYPKRSQLHCMHHGLHEGQQLEVNCNHLRCSHRRSPCHCLFQGLSQREMRVVWLQCHYILVFLHNPQFDKSQVQTRRICNQFSPISCLTILEQLELARPDQGLSVIQLLEAVGYLSLLACQAIWYAGSCLLWWTCKNSSGKPGKKRKL